ASTFRFDIVVANDLAPAGKLALEEGRKLLRRARCWNSPDIGELACDLRVRERSLYGGVELGDHGGRRLCRREQRVPIVRTDPRAASLSAGRPARKARRARG